MEPDGYKEYIENKYGLRFEICDEFVDFSVLNPFNSFLANYVREQIDASLVSEIEDVLDLAEKKYGHL